MAFAYDAATFTQKSVYVTTPNGGLGGFWMSGAGVAADASGNIFIASGNGDFDTTNVPHGNGRHDIETGNHQPDSDAAGLLHSAEPSRPGYAMT